MEEIKENEYIRTTQGTITRIENTDWRSKSMKDIEILEEFAKEYKDTGYFGIIKAEQIQILDNILKERQADKEKIKELESDNYECNNIIREYIEDWELKNKIIELMAEHLTTPIHSKKDVVEYFENLAKESGEIDENVLQNKKTR